MPARLCRTCKSFDLKIEDFNPWGRTRQGARGQFHHSTGEYNIDRVGAQLFMGELTNLTKRRQCELCMLVVSILKLQKPDILQQKFSVDPITETDTGDPINVSLYWVSKPLMDLSWPDRKHPVQPLMLGVKCSTLLHVDSYLVPSYEEALLNKPPAKSSQYYARPKGGREAKARLTSFWMQTCL